MKLVLPRKDYLSFSTISIGGGEEMLHLQIPGDQVENCTAVGIHSETYGQNQGS